MKAKFPPNPGVVVFVSLAPENLDELAGLSFTVETIGDLEDLVGQFVEKVIPYACIGGFSKGVADLVFSCHEFQQEENLITGEIMASSVETYHNRPVDLEAAKRDLKKLMNVIESVGNA